MSRNIDYKSVQIDETGNVMVQLFNILLEAVSTDKRGLQRSVEEAYNKLLSTLSTYVNLNCLHPVKRYLLEQSLMSDVILSHLEYLDESENNSENIEKNWLKLSGRTKALIAIAVSECSKTGVMIQNSSKGIGMRVESV